MTLTQRKEPIAIVGSGCRFPGGASSPSKLWELLKSPRDVLREIPTSRFNTSGFHHENPEFPGHANVKHSYLLDENVAQFDAQFFNVNASEAAAMDPQQRVLLETVYEALESAGLTIEGLRGSDTGVYVGLMFGDYEALQFRDLQSVPTYHAIGTARSIMSNRISYFFDWHGPSFTIDTACSSSIVAVHQAVQSLRSGEVHVALAAGTNLLLGPEPYIAESKLKMLSPESRSRMWDKDANGYARGDGVAAIVLKTLRAAIADGDHVEAIIRETGVNQDGRSRGITMPSASAQTALIRETYDRAGLNIQTDRCQYFEAHGTGTPAGDPVEAEAIHMAFFGQRLAEDEIDTTPLYVGSIKTVIGHTEGTAGIAGILKAVQSLKNGYIAPNLLFNSLNPDVAPFYKHLQIPQQLIPWPEVKAGQLRRASVNSFGFGGTNGHVILESFQCMQPERAETSLATPFLFSGQSKQSLLANLTAYSEYLAKNPGTNPVDLAWTLRVRRSRLPLRVSFPASPIDELQSNLQDMIGNFQLDARSVTVSKANHRARILGIFTGQGAQYARMGAEIVETSPVAAAILADLDSVLSELPELDRPSFTLQQELLAEAASSNVGKAMVSQPLCTALQIILVELMRLAGIEFAAVVGHSSGEIAAAFAAGYLSARDAIRIAYYRGFHSHLAGTPNGTHGAMLAAGTSLEDAQELCKEPEFEGRVCVAACNSPSSITLSGDEDAIADMKALLEDESKFARQLRVDKAYHSHHMLACAGPYLEALHNIGIKTQTPKKDCVWVSSVRDDQSTHVAREINGQYWIDNLVSPVLFRQAVERSTALGPFDAVIEVGPHPALKGPVLETLKSVEVNLPYTGLLLRNVDAKSSLSRSLGYLWTYVDNLEIDFDRYEEAISGQKSYRFLSDLPQYQWNHSQEYWHESNISRNLRSRLHPVHPLLGDLCPQSTPQRLIWKNVLRPQDLPWIGGHQVQGQMVFPAAGYATTALETISFLTEEEEQEVQLVELEDFRVHQAVVFSSIHDSGIEVQTTVSHIIRTDPTRITAYFTFESCASNQATFQLVADCNISIYLGQPSPKLLPASKLTAPHMIPVPEETFYSALAEQGYGYSGVFKSLSNLNRKLGMATGSVAVTTEPGEHVLAVHPATMDAAFHSIILALSYPRDGQLWTLHLPTHIERLRVNPALCGSRLIETGNAPFVAFVADVNEHFGFRGDVELHSPGEGASALQVQGIRVVPLTASTAADDKHLFYMAEWINAEPNAEIPGTYEAKPEEDELAYILERGCCFYLRQLEQQIPLDHPGRADKFNAAYLNFAAHTNRLCETGKHRYAKSDWLNDTLEDIMEITERFKELPEVRAMHIVGEQMPRAIRGETTMLEHLLMTGLLDEYYAEALGMSEGTKVLAETVLQVARRYPSMRILEVGAGTGGATREILSRLGHSFSLYTFTDISTGFFPNAQEEFASHKHQMQFITLDLEEEPLAQGFKKNSYDLIVASLVVHATANLGQTMRRVRSLLKPGGYLIMSEGTNLDVTRATALFGCLPGWWLGMDEGRTLSPSVTATTWDSILRETGFSGIDTMTPYQDSPAFGNSVIVTQAVDDWVEFIRSPLLAESSLLAISSTIHHLFVVGGTSFQISRLARDVQKHIGAFCEQITWVKTLDGLDHDLIDSRSTVLVLSDLDQPVFKDITDAVFDSLKKLFGSEKTIIWISENRLVDNPYANMPVGFARSAQWEVPDLHYQFVDFGCASRIDARVVTESTLRFQASVSAQTEGGRNALWTAESEIHINSEGHQLVPRLKSFTGANDRYNSARRTITQPVSPGSLPVFLSKDDGQYHFHEHELRRQNETQPDDVVPVALSHSSLRCIKTVVGDVFPILAQRLDNGASVFTVTDSLVSLVDLPANKLVECTVPAESESLFLSFVMAHLFALELVKPFGQGATILVNDPPSVVAAVLSRHTTAAGINVCFISSSQETAEQKGWVHVRPYSLQSQISSLLPKDISRVIDFGAQPSPALSRYPAHICVSADSIFPLQQDKSHFALSDEDSLRVILDTARLALADVNSGLGGATEVYQMSIADLTSNTATPNEFTILDWKAESLDITLQPISTNFLPNRTYWLVGLSGDMGLSIASWMIRHGARNLAITSRNPKINPDWLESTKREGVTVHILSNDLTDLNALEKTYHTIRATLPPVAGVAQGAMVLHDVATREMTLDNLTRVLRPKVEGSLNLDKIFYDEPLDFFVFFSSTASLAGNPGQANYCAANMFMQGLAEQRRRRGLAASVMDLGAVLGTGYITREIGDEQIQAVSDRGFMILSESDVHQTFAEAVRASRVDSGCEAHISTGLRRLTENTPNRPGWYNIPKFSCLTIQESGEDTRGSQQQPRASIKERLAAAKTTEDVQEVITETFKDEMRNLLQVSEEYEITTSMRTDELGLDSLVAVRIRSWFLNNYQVNIPALKILQGVPLQEIIDQALDALPETLFTVAVDSNESPRSDENNACSSQQSILEESTQTETPPSTVSQSQDASSVDELDIEHSPKGAAAPQVELKRFGPPSYAQSMFLFAHELLNDKTTVNNAALLHLRGELRIADLKRALELLTQHHEIMRTCFLMQEGQMVQGVMASSPITLEHRKICNQKELFQEYETLKNHVFDLRCGQTMRVMLLSHSPRDHYMIMAYHHIVFDRASILPFMADLERLYWGQNIERSPLQYLDFSNDQHEKDISGGWINAINFWKTQFETIPDQLPLHRSKISRRMPLQKYASQTSEHVIDVSLSSKIRQLVRRLRSTPFHLYIAAFKVLLFRFLGVEDVCIGMADNFRREDKLQFAIGPFLNILPLRLAANKEESCEEAITDARDKSLQAMAHSIPLGAILKGVPGARNSSQAPLAQAFINYSDDDSQDAGSFLGCETKMLKHHEAEVAYDISFTIVNRPGETARVSVNVQDSLYLESDARSLAENYEEILQQFVTAPAQCTVDTRRYPEPDLQRALTLGRGDSFNGTWPGTLVHRFEQIFARAADKVAVTDSEGGSLKYVDFYRLVDNIAHEMVRMNVTPGSRVAVFQHPSIYWVPSFVAILKIGAVYVPLDAGTPMERLTNIVKDCSPTAILVHDQAVPSVDDLRASEDMAIINVSGQLHSVSEPMQIHAELHAPAVILYTSGSTGTPKGVVLEHASLKHEFEHCAAVYGLGHDDVVLQQSAWSFDLSITQICLSLSVGARLHIISHLKRADSHAIVKTVASEGITATYATPTEYKSWLKQEYRDILHSTSWKLALVAGEAVTEPLLEQFRNANQPTLRLFNVYGPTETTCGSTKMELTYTVPDFYQGTIPVGRASADECFYILDESQNLQPIGQIGEVVIGGVGVAMGYLNNDELTRRSFLPDIFAPTEYLERGWNRMYRTGDVGYLREDGTLILKGRVNDDTEIKHNGVRIDLKDIEHTVLKAADGTLTDAVASQRVALEQGAKFIVVHVVFSEKTPIENDRYFVNLLESLPLPRTVLPAAIIPIDALPRTIAGKTDRRASQSLPIPRMICKQKQNLSLTGNEAEMRDMWESVIPNDLVGLHQIDAHSDFFAVGGSSLALIELQSKIRQRFPVMPSLIELFQNSTLRSMTRLVSSEKAPDMLDESQDIVVIDWEAEVSLQPLSLKEATSPEAPAAPLSPPRIIVLTGATGFLGQNILKDVTDRVEKIICIAVRDITKHSTEVRLATGKVEYYEGDLRAPRLGMDEKTADNIFRQADAVIHNGADVSHLKTYASLRAANVQSTKELVRLCLPRRIPLHYISTTGVSMYGNTSCFAEASARDCVPPRDGLYGYVASKWASEIYLENAQAHFGLPVYIHRPSSIIRPNSTTTGEGAALDVLQNMLAYSQSLCAVPDMNGICGIVDLVHPKTVTAKIIHALTDSQKAKGIAWIHESGDQELSFATIADYLGTQTGKTIQTLPLHEWLARAKGIGLPEAMAAIIGKISDGQVMNFPKLLH